MTDPKYPHINVKLTGRDGNAFSIIGAVGDALRKHDVPQSERTIFASEATSGDYNNVLQTAMRWVEVS